jgi:uncharacterized membrane protein
MRKKAIFLAMALVFAFTLSFALSSDNAEATGAFPVLFNDSGRLFVEIADLGPLGPNEWALTVVFPDYTNINPADMAIGFYFWEPAEQDITITVTDMGFFTGNSYFAHWGGGVPGPAVGASVYGYWDAVFSRTPIITSLEGGVSMDQE